jgi:hypothetical protein
MKSDGYEPANQVAGDECKKCINTTPSPMHADMGCNAEFPLCLSGDNYEAPLGQAGDYCAPNNFPCFNTDGHGGVDEGCDEYYPICVGENYKMIDASCYGAKCTACFNSYEADWVPDYGCPADKPRCAMQNGENPQVNFGGDKCMSVKKYIENEYEENCNSAYCKEDPAVKTLRLSGDLVIGSSSEKVKYDPMEDATCFNENYDPSYSSPDAMEMYSDYVDLIEYGFADDSSLSEENGHVTNHRIAGMMMRMCFHDNSINIPHGKFEDYISQYIDYDTMAWNGPDYMLESSGADASVMMCSGERLHPNQNYDNTASRLLRAFQSSHVIKDKHGSSTSMKSKHGLSYADLLHNGCIAATIYTMGLDAEEVLVGGPDSYGYVQKPTNPMTFGRHDACYKDSYGDRQPLCGPTGLLPGLKMTPQEVNSWFVDRGLYECLWMALMFTHTTMDNMAFTCPLKKLPATATQEHVDTFKTDYPGPGEEKLYFGAGETLDYFEFFLQKGKHERREDLLELDEEDPSCDWFPNHYADPNEEKTPWPLTLIDCTLGLSNVKKEKDSTLNKLEYTIENFHNLGVASELLMCAFNQLGGHYQGTCEAPASYYPPPAGSCAPVPGQLLFGSYGQLMYANGQHIY